MPFEILNVTQYSQQFLVNHKVQQQSLAVFVLQRLYSHVDGHDSHTHTRNQQEIETNHRNYSKTKRRKTVVICYALSG